MSQLTFAQELSNRFVDNDAFWMMLASLRTAGVIETLHMKPADTSIESDDLMKLLYCAEVFVQTTDENLHRHAQEIAIQTLLVSKDNEVDGQSRGRALGLLTELGNFPGLKYVERQLGGGDESLLGLINRRISEKLSTVLIGNEELPLTDYQRRVWRHLPNSKATAITAPTSAGKSFLVVEHLCKRAELEETFNAVYVTPTRALLSEVHQKITERLTTCKDLRISSVPSLDSEHRARQIFVLTQERLSTLLSIAPIDMKFELIVVDEAQNISDDARGMILQDCLERISARSHETQVILLAPGAIGMPAVAKSFGITDLVQVATQLSPVLQNRIVLTEIKKQTNKLSVEIIGKGGTRDDLGVIDFTQSIRGTGALAVVAVGLGKNDGSLVYETGPVEAEKTARRIASILKSREDTYHDKSLIELSEFISEHVHEEYELADMVRHGVAYHYGRMPSLLREALEESFKQEVGGLRFLVCTTTLAQGVNLPARNVFIDTPKYGVGKELNPALLWNFVGRAGRLNKDVVGNVFLLNYDKWKSEPMNEFVPFHVKSAVTEAIVSLSDEVSNSLEARALPNAVKAKPENSLIRATAGLLVAHAARNDLRLYLAKVVPDNAVVDVRRLELAATTAYQFVGLPEHIVIQNWTIDPFGLKRLYVEILSKIKEDRINEMIPVNPLNAEKGFYQNLFGRIVETVDGSNQKFGALAGRLALDWMKGLPYPVILSLWVGRQRAREARDTKTAIEKGEQPKKPASVSRHIYNAFELIENVVRFQFVQLGKAYRDVLIHALRTSGNEDRIPEVFDFALALELGISSEAGTAYIELGLSRIAATAIENLANEHLGAGEFLSAVQAKSILNVIDITRLSPIIVDELRRLNLISELKDEHLGST